LQLITIFDSQTVHGDIQSNYFYGCGQFSTSNDYSGIWGALNGTLVVQNNIFQGCGFALYFNGPGAGNVIAANYATYSVQGADFQNQHSVGVHYNLYEHNVGKQDFADQIHGPTLMHTDYRNAFF